jgi:hypothetical protein
VLVSDLPVMAAFVAEHRVGEAVAPADPVARSYSRAFQVR